MQPERSLPKTGTFKNRNKKTARAKLLSALLLCIPLQACESNNGDAALAIEKYLAKGPIGTSPDFFLVRNSPDGPENVAVIYGFKDDKAFCYEVADIYMKRYPSEHYFCTQANY
ncbi:hypothetical protein [Pseudochrobactrum asaccharolyticum]|uniref:hypothetical protein n=1 Tax=Pseudochrobactrum asaccharolyticum TaxID=354351 RepID=UPI004041E0C5